MVVIIHVIRKVSAFNPCDFQGGHKIPGGGGAVAPSK